MAAAVAAGGTKQDIPILRQYPTPVEVGAAAGAAGSPDDLDHILTVGDLHGNVLMLIAILVQRGLLEVGEDEYEALFQAYATLDNFRIYGLYKETDDDKAKIRQHARDVVLFCKLVDQIRSKNPNHYILKLLGDILADRGASDVPNLLLPKQLREQGVESDTLASNHDAFFLDSISGAAKEPSYRRIPSEYVHVIADARTQSSLMRLGMIAKDEEAHRIVLEGTGLDTSREGLKQFVYEHYLPYLKIVDCRINDDGETATIYSHAPIDFSLIPALVKKFKIADASYGNVQELAATVEKINIRFREHVRERMDAGESIMDSLDEDGQFEYKEPKSNDIKKCYLGCPTYIDPKKHPIAHALWNRGTPKKSVIGPHSLFPDLEEEKYVDCWDDTLPKSLKGKLQYKHGHNGKGSEIRPDSENLDGIVGQRLSSTEEILRHAKYPTTLPVSVAQGQAVAEVRQRRLEIARQLRAKAEEEATITEEKIARLNEARREKAATKITRLFRRHLIRRKTEERKWRREVNLYSHLDKKSADFQKALGYNAQATEGEAKLQIVDIAANENISKKRLILYSINERRSRFSLLTWDHYFGNYDIDGLTAIHLLRTYPEDQELATAILGKRNFLNRSIFFSDEQLLELSKLACKHDQITNFLVANHSMLTKMVCAVDTVGITQLKNKCTQFSRMPKDSDDERSVLTELKSQIAATCKLFQNESIREDFTNLYRKNRGDNLYRAILTILNILANLIDQKPEDRSLIKIRKDFVESLEISSMDRLRHFMVKKGIGENQRKRLGFRVVESPEGTVGEGGTTTRCLVLFKVLPEAVAAARSATSTTAAAGDTAAAASTTAPTEEVSITDDQVVRSSSWAVVSTT